MSTIQIAFLVGLLLVLGAVTVFSGAVLRSAARGGRGASLGFTGRRAEHGELGRGAFLAHRVTGFAIFAFLCLHILDVALYSVSQRLYDGVQHVYGTAPLRLLESGLLFAVLFHTGNGLRLLAVDGFRTSPGRSLQLLRIVIASAVVLGAAGSALILAPLV